MFWFFILELYHFSLKTNPNKTCKSIPVKYVLYCKLYTIKLKSILWEIIPHLKSAVANKQTSKMIF